MAIKVKVKSYPHFREVTVGGTQGQVLMRTDATGAYNWQTLEATTDYNDLTNKPKINSVELSGNKSLDDLNVQAKLINQGEGQNIKTINGNVILGTGDVTITSPATWGSITGNINNQTDLNNTFLKIADQKTKTSQLTNDSGFITKDVDDLTNYTDTTTLNAQLALKANDADLATVAKSGSYPDLSNRPTNVSDFTNDAGFITNTVNNLTNYTTTTSLTGLLNAKQDKLYSGTNIKTLNNESLLGSGNIDVNSAVWGNIDGTLSNQADLNTALGSKQPTLVSGSNIKTFDGVSILGSGNLTSKVSSVNTQTGDVVLTQDDVGDGNTYVRTHNDFTTAKSTQIETNAQNIATNTSAITTINSKIPNAATSSNQLADKAFVNSSIASSTGTFRGTVETTAELEALTGNVNDYAFYKHVDALGNTLFDRFKYVDPAPTSGVHYGHWLYEYTLNNSSFTAVQWQAINSGITDALVGSYNTHIASTSNPHSVTKSQVGLGDVVNTGDSATPVSGGTTKFTTGGAYTELAKKQDNLNELATFANNKYLHTNSSTGALEWTDVSQGAIYSAGDGINIDSNYEISVNASTIPSLDASKIGSGTLNVDRVPSLPLSKISDVTATASEVNILDGTTVTTSELNYVHGVTSAIQQQIDAKVVKNNDITAATKCKITYDTKGLVTAGADLTVNDLPSGITDAKIASASTWNSKSTVSVSATGTATDLIGYITVDGTEKKIAGGSIPIRRV